MISTKEKDLNQQVTALTQRITELEDILYVGKEVLSLVEAARFLGVTKSNLYHMTHEQLIPYFKPGGKMCYFEKSELLNWMKSNRISSGAEIEAAVKEHMRMQVLKK